MAEPHRCFLSCGKNNKQTKKKHFKDKILILQVQNRNKWHSQNKEEFLVDAGDAGSDAEQQYANSHPHMDGFQEFT